MNDYELKPCPFCGGYPEIVSQADENLLKHRHIDYMDYEVTLRCKICGISMKSWVTVFDGKLAEEAILAKADDLIHIWNRRADNE